MVEEQRYRRLLRWYPRSWRARHGEALLGIMLDEAEALGRSLPSVGQRWSVFVHGMGTRLSARSALWCAVAGILLRMAGFALIIILISAGAARDGVNIFTWVHSAATTLSWALVIAGALGIARERGVLPAPNAFVAMVATALTCVVATVAGVAWTAAFEAADVGAPAPALGRLDKPLLLACGVSGALAAAIVVDGVLRIRTRMSVLPRTAVAATAGIPSAAVAITVATLEPFLVVAAALVLVILSVSLRRPGSRKSPVSPAPPISQPSHQPLHAEVPEYPQSQGPPERQQPLLAWSGPRSQAVSARDTRSTGERIGARLDRRTALACGILTVATYIGSMVLMVATPFLPTWMDASPFFMIAVFCLAAFFLAVGVISLLRERAAVSPRHATYAILLSGLVLICGAAFAALSAVDVLAAGSRPRHQWSDHTGVALLVVSWCLAAATLGVLIDGLSACRRMEPGLRAVVGLLAGALATPPLVILVLLGWVSAVGAIGLIIAAAADRSAPGQHPVVPPNASRPGPRAASPLSRHRITWIRLLAVSAVVLGVVTIAWAVPDRAAGAASAHLALIPLLAAIALWVSGRFPSTAVSTWGSAVLTWASTIGFAATAWRPQLREAFVVPSVSALCGAAALAWVLFTWFPGGRVRRFLVGAGAGLVHAITLALSVAMLEGYFLFALVPMLTPAYGLIILRRPPSPRPSPVPSTH